ncbi:MAG: M28 family peptidase, partial [Bacteroidetes bacterium]|nr:M28 family peptidase [Bacteroidota bacterium]
MKQVIIFLLVLFSLQIKAQNKEYAKNIIKQLTSEEFDGRGYVNDGALKAADFIRKELKTIEVEPINSVYMQEFYIPVNRFDGDVEVSIDEKKLIPGTDFIVSPSCPSGRGTYKLVQVDSESIDNLSKFNKFKKKKFYGKMFLLDMKLLKNVVHKDRLSWILGNGMRSKGLVFMEDKLTWSVAGYVDSYISVTIKKGAIQPFPQEITFSIEADFINGFTSNNVFGKITGTEKPDSYIVFTAHYDHLGKMGRDAVFSGANDNAGGVAMLLDLAKHYKQNKPKCTVVFMFFAAE